MERDHGGAREAGDAAAEEERHVGRATACREDRGGGENDGVGGGGCDDGDPVAWARRELRKADTFNDRGSLNRGDKSMSQDELKRRAEAFIKKINYEMRLERLESQQRLMEMVNGGV